MPRRTRPITGRRGAIVQPDTAKRKRPEPVKFARYLWGMSAPVGSTQEFQQFAVVVNHQTTGETVMQNKKSGNSKSRRNNRVAKKTSPRRRPSGHTRRPSENQMEAGSGHHRPENA